MELKASVHRRSPFPIRARSLRIAALALLVAVLVAVLTGAATYRVTTKYLSPSPSEALWKWAQDRGHNILRDDVQIRDAIARAPARIISSKVSPSTALPELVVDIKFKHMQKLYKKREEALARGKLVQGPDDFVPASIRHGGRTTKVKVRLKGDMTDHLEGDKWSFRIHVKGKDHVFGMRRFSIQTPKARGFQGEALFYATLRHVGVLTLRYRFVNVTVNGNRIGVMAVEEHFSKELLESNRRREGVIVRFDESLFWDADLRGSSGIFDDFRNAPIDAFRSSRIAKSARLTKDYGTAVGLLRGFVDRRLPASDVFDGELMGRFLAVSKLWGSWHGIRWNSMRFYLNPITAKLEPIGFDASLQTRGDIDEPLVADMLEDPEIFAAYRRTLRRLAVDIGDGVLAETLKKIDDRLLAVLRDEFYLLERFPYDELRARAKHLGALSDEDLLGTATSNASDHYPILLHAYLLKDDGKHFLELINAVFHDVEVQSVSWESNKGRAGAEFESLSDHGLPLRLPARIRNSPPVSLRIPYRPPPDAAARTLRVSANIRGDTRRRTVEAKPYYPPLKRNPIPTSTVDEQLSRHDFLELDKKRRALRVRPGVWRVRGVLVVPSGFALTIPAGTTLRFDARGALVAHGPLHVGGAEGNPVILEGTPEGEGTWQGIVVLGAPGWSQWSHVEVRNTSGIDFPGWQLTGGLTFYNSDIRMEHALLQGHRGEDALNVIGSKFAFKDLSIVDAASDGFDSDFSDGSIEGGTFERIGKAGGGDAIDVSGSEVRVEGTRFVDIGDKALSVGEGSEMTAIGVVIEHAGTGAAAKDGSKLRIDASTIKQARHAALMAYVKKPEFGFASIEANNLEFVGAAPRARAQKGSAITIDETAVETEDVDVEQLYKTIMRPGLRR